MLMLADREPFSKIR
uniref:Uncharacterized protein n=1 Tax=Arundo donax TaxID=35708 RepID=A0A0A9B9J0_ARUDO